MKVTTVEIHNFRLLKDVELVLDERATVVVGRNNSGKTSLTELFRRLLGEASPKFHLEDFSLSALEAFWQAFVLHQEGKEEPEVRAALPTIRMKLTVSYDPAVTDLGTLSEFIIDLNPDSTVTNVEARYELSDGMLSALFEGDHFPPDSTEEEKKLLLLKMLKERVPKHYGGVLRAIDPNDDTNQRLMEWSRLRELLQGGFITAQRGLDDITNKENDVLGKVLEGLFRTAQSDNADAADQASVEQLKTAVEQMEDSIGADFRTHLDALLPALNLFGYPGLADPGLSTETTLTVDSLLKEHTKIRYAGVSGMTLPEAYNGLGTRNLIFILLRLLELFKFYKANEAKSGIQLVFIEEPEAHLHPQMQAVFIRKLAQIAERFATDYNEGRPWPVQFVVTTHSPHMANEADFDATRYFVAGPDGGGTICSTKIKDLSTGLGGVPAEDKKFLHQYMTLTRCDLLFADKAILIEGATERLLLPKLIDNLGEATEAKARLTSQYISVVEVGGAYAHRFFDLLKFLELQTLIITDLDAVNAAAGGTKCKVSESTGTSNACIKKWFGDPLITPATVVAKGPEDLIGDVGDLASQVPEEAGGPCGRSFEDAFMLANPELFGLGTGSNDELENLAWDKASKVKKTEFALKFAIDEPDWTVPRYISDGLKWLAGDDPVPADGDQA